MSDSLGSATRASDFGTRKEVKQRKGTKRKNLTKNHQKSTTGPDTPEAREARIRLYMERANINPDSDKATPRTGPNGRPINIFTGVEATAEDVEVVEVEEFEDDNE
jgi:hypothetical protein